MRENIIEKNIVLKNNQRIEHIDILKGIGILLMIMGHLEFGGGFDHYIHAFHMPIFFFISGFLHKSKEKTKMKTIIKKKAKSLLIPYLIFGMFHYIIYVILKYKKADNLMTPLKSLFWINFEGIPIAGALWFLTSIFFTEIIYELLTRKVKNRKILIMIIILIALLGNVITYKLPYSINASMVGIGFFFLGENFKKHKDKILEKLNQNNYNCIILMIFNIILIFINGDINMRTGKYSFIPLFWINALTSIILWWDISKKIESKKENKYLKQSYNMIKFIGENSIVFLCLNQVVIKFINELVLSNIIQNQIFIIEVIIKMITLLVIIIILSILTVFIKNTKLKALIGK